LLEHARKNRPRSDALAGKKNGAWDVYSSKGYDEHAHHLAYGMLSLGLEKGDCVATVSSNRPEWNFTDMALMLTGMVHVPIYRTITPEDYIYILNHCEAKAIVISDQLQYEKLKPVIAEVPSLEHVFTMDKVEGAGHLEDLTARGKKRKKDCREKLEKIKKGIHENDMATLIYTSGTTGKPKGVMLSHRNIMSNTIATSKVQPLSYEKGHKVISFLPLCHIYERMINYHYQYLGLGIYYVDNMAAIADTLKELSPHGFCTVPRMLEMLYDKIIAKGKDLEGFKKKLFFWAVKVAERYELNNANGPVYAMKLAIARKLVFSKWREALGGQIIMIVSGGAALQSRLERVFHAAGIAVMQGYGLTESAPVIAVNWPHYPKLRFGTVGPVLEGVKVKIAKDGEILCKGPNVMLGYYKEPGLTRKVIDEDGWLHTGDVGELQEGGFLKITDRKKEMFKTSAGKYIAPQVIENKLKESELIEQVMVVGENQKHAGAIISPNFNYLHFYASKYKIHYRDNLELIQNDQVIRRVQEEVLHFNQYFGQTEQIARFRLVGDSWGVDSGELTPTLKLKRRNISQKYDRLITEMFHHTNGEHNNQNLTVKPKTKKAVKEK
jgi:long-chain acyl-CoA synthetase